MDQKKFTTTWIVEGLTPFVDYSNISGQLFVKPYALTKLSPDYSTVKIGVNIKPVVARIRRVLQADGDQSSSSDDTSVDVPSDNGLPSDDSTDETNTVDTTTDDSTTDDTTTDENNTDDATTTDDNGTGDNTDSTTTPPPHSPPNDGFVPDDINLPHPPPPQVLEPEILIPIAQDNQTTDTNST